MSHRRAEQREPECRTQSLKKKKTLFLGKTKQGKESKMEQNALINKKQGSDKDQQITRIEIDAGLITRTTHSWAGKTQVHQVNRIM